MELDENQEKAVMHKGSPLLIAAGPGSGKTRVIVERIRFMLDSGARPSEILCLTFSERAAKEMAERLGKDDRDVSDMYIGTFHAYCKQILEDHILESGIATTAGIINSPAQKVWGINNVDKLGLEHIRVGYNAATAITPLMEGIRTFKKEKISPERLEKYLKKQQDAEMTEEEADYVNKLGDLCRTFYEYRQYQREHSVIDYDDMITETITLLESNKLLREQYKNRYRHIFVDEFQDNNYVQLELVKLLAKDGNVTVVGDEDQCIYRFQGAYLRNFDDFRDHFQGAEKKYLNRNYRSTGNIVKLAKSCLENMKGWDREKDLHSKEETGEKIQVVTCKDEASEAEFVAKQIKEMLGTQVRERGTDRNRTLEFDDFAVLSRRRIEGKKFADRLRGMGIPVVFTSESDVSASPVMRDLMSNLRIAVSASTAGVEIIRLLRKNGVPDSDVTKIDKAAKKKAYGSSVGIDYVFETLQSPAGLGITHRAEVEDTQRQIKSLIKSANTHGISRFVYDTIMTISGLMQGTIAKDTEEHRRYQRILRETCDAAQEYEEMNPSATLADFIKYLEMGHFELDIEQEDKIEKAVLVTTIHQSKGKEFPVVFITDVAAGKLPLRFQSKPFHVPAELSHMADTEEDPKELHEQEERRLFYVGMTRAQNRLFITYCSKYGQNVKESKPSKFLEELDFENNPLIMHTPFEKPTMEAVRNGTGSIKKIKQDRQEKASQAIDRMQIQSAIKRMLELAKIQHYERHGNVGNFDSRSILSVNVDDFDIGEYLSEERPRLIDRETITLSKTKLETYKKCPLQFKFRYVMQIPTKPGAAMDLGSAVHKVIESATKRQMEGKAMAEDEAFAMLEKLWNAGKFGSRTASEQKKADARACLSTFLGWSSSNPNIPIAVEKRFEMDIAGVRLNGSIDRVEQTPAGEYVLIDYKTGRADATKNSIKTDIQMNVYAMATEKLYGKLPEKTSLFYLEHDKRVENVIEPSMVKKVREDIENMIQDILAEEFPAEPSFKNCMYCDFVSICDARETRH